MKKETFILEDGEEVLERIHRHWFLFLLTAVKLLIAALLPLVLYYVAFANESMLSNVSVAINTTSLAVFLYSLWLLAIWVALFVALTDYYLDVWIITNRRIIDVEQNGLFARVSTSCFVTKIQDIEVEVNGIVATFLNFGDITIHTAGAEREIFTIRGAPDPGRVKTVISNLQS